MAPGRDKKDGLSGIFLEYLAWFQPVYNSSIHHTTTLSAPKKRKISGLSVLELDLALTQLKRLRSSVIVEIVEEVPELDTTPADAFTDELDSMIATLESRISSPLVLIVFLPRLQCLNFS